MEIIFLEKLKIGIRLLVQYQTILLIISKQILKDITLLTPANMITLINTEKSVL